MKNLNYLENELNKIKNDENFKKLSIISNLQKEIKETTLVDDVSEIYHRWYFISCEYLDAKNSPRLEEFKYYYKNLNTLCLFNIFQFSIDDRIKYLDYFELLFRIQNTIIRTQDNFTDYDIIKGVLLIDLTVSEFIDKKFYPYLTNQSIINDYFLWYDTAISYLNHYISPSKAKEFQSFYINFNQNNFSKNLEINYLFNCFLDYKNAEYNFGGEKIKEKDEIIKRIKEIYKAQFLFIKTFWELNN